MDLQVSNDSRKEVSLGRETSYAASSVVGGILILAGLAGLARFFTGSADVILSPLLFLASGIALAPPFVEVFRSRWGILKPIWAPPALSFGLLFLAVATAPNSTRPITPVPLAESESQSVGTSKDAQKLSPAPKLKQPPSPAKPRVDAQVIAYVGRITTENLPRVNAILSTKPRAMILINVNLGTLNDAAKALEEGKSFGSDATAKAAMLRLRRAMIEKQRIALPAMRAGYGAIMDETLWESDADVIVQGGGNRTIRMISAAFAANRNIAEVQRNSKVIFSVLRFKRVQYEWYRGSEYQYYDVDSPSDKDIGYWSDGVFTHVKE